MSSRPELRHPCRMARMTCRLDLLVGGGSPRGLGSHHTSAEPVCVLGRSSLADRQSLSTDSSAPFGRTMLRVRNPAETGHETPRVSSLWYFHEQVHSGARVTCKAGRLDKVTMVKVTALD